MSLNNRSVQYSQGHKNLTRDYSKFSEANFIDELSGLDLITVVSSCNNPSKSFSMFYNKLHKLINKHAPLVPVSKRKAKLYCKPWITKGIRKSITIKNSLFYSGNSEKYKYYRNKILTLTRISKKVYYHKYFEDNFSNIKKTW